jgi:hypothetical protein
MLVLAPWVGRNLATFKDATYISTGDGLALLGSNCPQTYSGPEIGLWSLHCATSIKGGGDESVQSSRDQHAALQYVEHHADRLPIVMLARVGREWDLYKPVQMAHVEAGEGRPFAASLAGLGFYYALLPFSVAGIIILRRRRIDQWFLLVPAAVVTLVSALVIALVRYRAPFEVCLVVLAAPGMVLLAQRLSGRPSSVSEAPAAAAGPGPGESSGEVPHLCCAAVRGQGRAAVMVTRKGRSWRCSDRLCERDRPAGFTLAIQIGNQSNGRYREDGGEPLDGRACSGALGRASKTVWITQIGPPESAAQR